MATVSSPSLPTLAYIDRLVRAIARLPNRSEFRASAPRLVSKPYGIEAIAIMCYVHVGIIISLPLTSSLPAWQRLNQPTVCQMLSQLRMRYLIPLMSQIMTRVIYHCYEYIRCHHISLNSALPAPAPSEFTRLSMFFILELVFTGGQLKNK